MIKNLLLSVFHALPTAAVLLALAALGYFGHRNGWTVPSFAQLFSASAAEDSQDWCTTHNVPESRCIGCNPHLVGGNVNDWCREHAVPESRCTICHPELLVTGVAGDWCGEHQVPESSCTICHPEIARKSAAPPSETGSVVTGADEHAAQNPKNPATCQSHQFRVQFASADSVRKAGVKLAAVQQRTMASHLSAPGEINYDPTRLAQIASPAPGRAWRVEARLGQRVRQGDLLALIDAAEVGKAKADLLAAAAAVEVRTRAMERLQDSAASGFRSQTDLFAAEAELKEARVRLYNARQALVNFALPAPDGETIDERSIQFLGIPGPVVAALDPKTTTANLLPLFAPFDGVIIARNLVAGEVVEPARALFTLADTSRLWLTIDLPVAEALRVTPGQPVLFRPDFSGAQAVAGEISWIATDADEQTRTVRVGAEINNPDARLPARTFGEARITIRQHPNATAVPTHAIHWEGCCHIVFVSLPDHIFQVRKVRPGARANGFTEITVGLLPGEVVATEGSHVLKSEILKSALGAGCTEH